MAGRRNKERGREGRHGAASGGHTGRKPGKGRPGTRRGLFGGRRVRKAPAPGMAAPEEGATDAPREAAPAEAGQAETVAAAEPQPQPVGERLEIPLPGGSTLRALLLRPRDGARDVPGMLWIHGDAPSEVAAAPAEPAVAKLLWDHRACAVLCLDHPASVADCHLALAWLRDHARAWGVATDQLMVGGEGMGADLAIRLCRYERDEGHIGIAWQLPLYPSLDEGWLAGLAGMARSLGYRGLPCATTVVGMDDFCRKATIAFVEGMREDGVEVDFHMYRGHFSGTGMWGETASVREARSFIVRQFDEAVQTRRAPQASVRRLDLPSID